MLEATYCKYSKSLHFVMFTLKIAIVFIVGSVIWFWYMFNFEDVGVELSPIVTVSNSTYRPGDNMNFELVVCSNKRSKVKMEVLQEFHSVTGKNEIFFNTKPIHVIFEHGMIDKVESWEEGNKICTNQNMNFLVPEDIPQGVWEAQFSNHIDGIIRKNVEYRYTSQPFLVK